MKKLYAILASAVLVFSASAAETFKLQQAPVSQATLKVEKNAVSKAFTHKSQMESISLPQVKVNAKIAKTISRADEETPRFATNADFNGPVKWNYFGLLEGQGQSSAEISIKVTDEASGAAEINGIFSVPIAATVNAAAGTVTIANNQFLGQDKDGDVYFYLKDLVVEGENATLADGASAAAEVVGTVSGNTVLFPENLVFAAGDPAAETLGWYFLTAMNEFVYDANVRDLTTWEGILGEYDWAYYGLLQNNSGWQTGTMTLAGVDQTTGEAAFLGFFAQVPNIPVFCTVDLEKGTVTVPNMQLLDIGEDETEGTDDDIYFYLKDLDMTTGRVQAGVSAVEETVGTISGTTITFPEDIVWALGFPKNEIGYYNLTAMNEFTAVAEEDDSADWEDYTTGTFVDGWIITSYSDKAGNPVNPENYALDVAVKRSVLDSNVFCIVNPYLSEAGFPTDEHSKGKIVFDITDPEYVLALTGYKSGATIQGMSLYCFNLEGYFTAQGLDKATVQANADKTGITSYSSLTEEGTLVTFYNNVFDTTPACDNPSSWQDDNENPIEMTSMLAVNKALAADAGVDKVAVTNAPAEYYNLQGIRVDNPVKGIYIVRQGNKARKVIF